MMKIKLPESVTTIIHRLEANGHEAYAVGGCVRDSVMGNIPADWDITTSAKPAEVKAIFDKTIDTGIEHGTVTVRLNKENFEITTYRIDGEYLDSRHPQEVTYTTDLLEDLRRRDFTMNAMAYNDTVGMVDAFGGMEDIKNHVIRCVGIPQERFSEDALRMLRAVRFAAQLDFELEQKTFEAIRELSHTLVAVSQERIQVEFVKLLVSQHPGKMQLAYESGLTAVFFPEWDAMVQTPQNNIHHMYNVAEHTIRVLYEVPPQKGLRLAALLHDVAKPLTKKTDQQGRDHFVGHPSLGATMSKEILRRLKFDNATIAYVSNLVCYHDDRIACNKRNTRREIAQVGLRVYPDLLVLRRADILGQSMHQRLDKLERVACQQQFYQEIVDEEECVTVKDLAVNGRELLAIGIKQGPAIGAIMQKLLHEVVDEPKKNQKNVLLAEAEEMYQQMGEKP